MSRAADPAYPRKVSVEDLAALGAPPLFDRPRSIGQLYTPDFDAFRPMLQSMLRSGQLSDHGPFVQALEQRLAAMHGVDHCVCLANAALGLMMLMQIFGGGRGGEILMPGFSYRGLPHFARWAGLDPAFCDVDAGTHVLCPRALERRITPRTRAILAVATCYSSGPMDDYVAIGARSGVPVFFDSVYGVGMTHAGAPLGGHGAAEVFSLHATKLLNGFEGGYVTTRDGDLADRLRGLRDGADDTQGAWGLEARLNEAHAAMALLSLDGMDSVIARNRSRYDAYVRALGGEPGLSLVRYGDDERYNYELVIADIDADWPLTRDEMLTLLRAENAAVSVYYAPPLHRAWKAGPAPPSLPVADALAQRFLQLPVGEGVSIADIEAIGRLFQLIRHDGAEVARRLRTAAA